MVYFLIRNIILAAALMSVPTLFGEFWSYQLALYMLYALAATGLGLAWGQTGILSLGHALFFGAAAYLSAFVLMSPASPILVYGGVFCAALAAAALAFSAALIVFQGKTESGPSFSMITLALALCGFQIATTWSSMTGGFNGLVGVPSLPGADDTVAMYYVVAIVLALSLAVYDWLVRAPIGVVWRAIAQNERRVAFLGYRAPLLKAVAFAIAGGFAGLAGALYAPQQNLVTPDVTGFTFSGSLVVFAAVGGRFSVLGPACGAIIIGILSAELRDRFVWWELVIALFFILVVIRFPKGLMTMFAPIGRLKAFQRSRIPTPVGAPKKKVADQDPMSFSFDDVRVKMGEVTILDGLSFSSGDEGIICVIGPNGAGKTSTLNVLTGALPMRSGVVAVAGKRIRRPRPSFVARLGVGRKFQTPSLFQELTIGENLAIGLWVGRARWFDMLRPSLLGWTSPVRRELEHRFPFLQQSERTVSALSHGERQVLELSMALLGEPTLLLLDEPCAGLSHDETAKVSALIKWARAELGLRILIIEHDMELVRQLADRVVVLHQGRFLAHGSIEAVQANEDVRAVYMGGKR